MISESELMASNDYEPENKQPWRRLTLAVLACIVGSSLLFGSSGKTSMLSSSSAQATLGLAEDDECGCQSKKSEADSKCPPACSPFSWGCKDPLAHGACIAQAKVSESICFSDCAKLKVQAAKDHLDSAQEAVKGVASNAKDHLDSAQETVKDAAKGATVNSLVNNAKDHLDSAQETVKDAAKGATVNSLVNNAKDHLDSAQEEVKDAAKGATEDHLDSATQEAIKDAATGATVNSLVNNAKDTLAAVSDEIKSRSKCMAALKPCVMKCGIDVPSEGKDGTTESELQNIDTKDLTKSAKKCMKKCYACFENCTKEGKRKAKKFKRKARKCKARGFITTG